MCITCVVECQLFSCAMEIPINRILELIGAMSLGMTASEGGELRAPGGDPMGRPAVGEVVEEGEVSNIYIVGFGNVLSLELFPGG